MVLNNKIYKLLSPIKDFTLRIGNNILINIQMENINLFADIVRKYKYKSFCMDTYFDFLCFEINISEFKEYPEQIDFLRIFINRKHFINNLDLMSMSISQSRVKIGIIFDNSESYNNYLTLIDDKLSDGKLSDVKLFNGKLTDDKLTDDKNDLMLFFNMNVDKFVRCPSNVKEFSYSNVSNESFNTINFPPNQLTELYLTYGKYNLDYFPPSLKFLEFRYYNNILSVYHNLENFANLSTSLEIIKVICSQVNEIKLFTGVEDFINYYQN